MCTTWNPASKKNVYVSVCVLTPVMCVYATVCVHVFIHMRILISTGFNLSAFTPGRVLVNTHYGLVIPRAGELGVIEHPLMRLESLHVQNGESTLKEKNKQKNPCVSGCALACVYVSVSTCIHSCAYLSLHVLQCFSIYPKTRPGQYSSRACHPPSRKTWRNRASSHEARGPTSAKRESGSEKKQKN